MPNHRRDRPPEGPVHESDLSPPLLEGDEELEGSFPTGTHGDETELWPLDPLGGTPTSGQSRARQAIKREANGTRNVRLAQVLFFFIFPIAVVAGIWGFMFRSGGDEKPAARAPAVVETATSLAVPTTVLDVTATSVRVASQPTVSEKPGVDEPAWATIVRSIVLLNSPQCELAGSGTLVLDGSFILTNAHIATDESGRGCDLEVWVVDSPRDPPHWVADAVVIGSAVDQLMDLAVVRIVDSLGNAITLRNRQPIQLAVSESFVFAQKIKVIGYPGMGGNTISQTSGEVSGFEGNFVKTDAKMGPGISGGAAFSVDTGAFLGVPTSGSSASMGSSGEMEGDWLGWIRPVSYAQTLLAKAKRSSN